MDNSMIVQVSYSTSYRINQSCCVILVKELFCADPIEQFSTLTKISNEVKVVLSLKVIPESDDILVTLRDGFEDSDFVANLVD